MKNALLLTCLTLLLAGCGAENSRRDKETPPPGNQQEQNPEENEYGEIIFKSIERSMITRIGSEKRLSIKQVKAALKEGKLLPAKYPLFPPKNKSMKVASPVDGIDYEGDCGKNTTAEFTVFDRIKDCSDNESILKYSKEWSGTRSGVSGEGDWRLVSYIDTKKVWIDNSTGLLWSDIIKVDTFDVALGKNEGGVIDSLCKSSDKDPNAAFGMIPEKNVIWRLPNKQEVLQAYLNGSSGVLSSESDSMSWTATFADDDKAWAVDEATGAISKVDIKETLNIRCIGVIIE
jgi:hypothetical protein